MGTGGLTRWSKDGDLENKGRGGPSETITYASGPQHLTEQRSRMRLVRALARGGKERETEKGVDGLRRRHRGRGVKVLMNNRRPKEPVAAGNRFVQTLEEEESSECDGGEPPSPTPSDDNREPSSNLTLQAIWCEFSVSLRDGGAVRERESVYVSVEQNALLFFETEPNKPE
jgi:hypothetical protein